MSQFDRERGGTGPQVTCIPEVSPDFIHGDEVPGMETVVPIHLRWEHVTATAPFATDRHGKAVRGRVGLVYLPPAGRGQ